MAVAKGRAFLLYIGTSAAVVTGSAAIQAATIGSAWALVGGAQERSLDIALETIDGVTAPASLTDPIWSSAIAGARSVTVNCSARFLNEESERLVLNAALSASAEVKALLVYPADDDAGDTASTDDVYGTQIFGRFLITSLSHSGSLSDTFNWSMTLASVGSITVVRPS